MVSWCYCANVATPMRVLSQSSIRRPSPSRFHRTEKSNAVASSSRLTPNNDTTNLSSSDGFIFPNVLNVQTSIKSQLGYRGHQLLHFPQSCLHFKLLPIRGGTKTLRARDTDPFRGPGMFLFFSLLTITDKYTTHTNYGTERKRQPRLCLISFSFSFILLMITFRLCLRIVWCC